MFLPSASGEALASTSHCLSSAVAESCGPFRSGKGISLPFLGKGNFGEAGALQPFPSEVLTCPGDTGRTVASGTHGNYELLSSPS